MKVLIFDTETTGLPVDQNASLQDSAKWPYIIQLSFIVLDTDTKEILEYSDSIIRLDETVSISPESIAIHQITAYRSQTEGIPIKVALAHLAENMSEVDVIVGHNIIFDKRMLMVEFHRNQMKNCLYKNGSAIPEYCTMKRTIELCKLPTVNKKTGEIYNKYPTLTELHTHLFGYKPRGAHNAIADVMICLRCYVMLNFKYDIACDPEVKMVFRSLFETYCGRGETAAEQALTPHWG
jgi:DNA polymerase III epsilon subunit-like protein